MDYGLIGESLSRNFSKTIHELSGLYTYELYEPAPCRADSFIRQHDFKGINVTDSFIGKINTHQQLYDRRFSAAALSGKGNIFTLFYADIYSVQHNGHSVL